MATGLKPYHVEAEIIVLTTKQVMANSMQEAIEKADQLSLTDFVKLKGDHNDSRVTIAGVSHSNLALYSD